MAKSTPSTALTHVPCAPAALAAREVLRQPRTSRMVGPVRFGDRVVFQSHTGDAAVTREVARLLGRAAGRASGSAGEGASPARWPDWGLARDRIQGSCCRASAPSRAGSRVRVLGHRTAPHRRCSMTCAVHHATLSPSSRRCQLCVTKIRATPSRAGCLEGRGMRLDGDVEVRRGLVAMRGRPPASAIAPTMRCACRRSSGGFLHPPLGRGDADARGGAARVRAAFGPELLVKNAGSATAGRW